MEQNFQYRGNLAKTGLPEVLFTIDRFQVPGVIEARKGATSKRVYIREGCVIHATSNDLEDSLGSYLFRQGKLSESVFQATMRDRPKQNKRLGELLVERQILSPAEVYEGIRSHLEGIVWSLFYWDDGDVTFSIGEFKDPDMLRIQLPMRQVIFSGIKRAPSAKSLVGRLGRKETVFKPNYTLEDVVELALEKDDYAVLQLVDGKRSLYEVCAEGPLSPSESAKLMYAFRVLQLVRDDAPAPPQGNPTTIPA
ncbi:MAG: DUF4388 domain-containing protein [Acidobacteria bacterium]|nr:DUF4388 domain-containing protein [Acidobacteriota bacterium]